MSMTEKDGVIWLDGQFVPWSEAKVHVLTHTLHYGMGVFEGIRAYQTEKGPAIFRLQEHIRRLFQSAHVLNMNMPYSQETLLQACLDSVRQNALEHAYIRPMCFYGAEGMGLNAKQLKTHVMVAAWEWGSYLGCEGLEQGIRIKTSSLAKNHINSSLCKAKANGHYINSMLALQEAIRDGYDEALLLDHQGYVAEGSGENIFIVRNGRLATPPALAALEGITRDTIIRLAQDNNIPVEQRCITRDEVYISDEVFFTGTAAWVPE